MELTTLDMVDLVTVTVKDLGGGVDSVRYNDMNIFINDKPIPLWKLMDCRNSAKRFIDLIKETL